MDESTSNEGSATTDAIAMPNRDPPDITRIKPTAAKRVQAHRWRRRLGLWLPRLNETKSFRHSGIRAWNITHV